MSERSDKSKRSRAFSFWKLCAANAWRKAAGFAFRGRDPQWYLVSAGTTLVLAMSGLIIAGVEIVFGEQMILFIAVLASPLVMVCVLFAIYMLYEPPLIWSELRDEVSSLKALVERQGTRAG